MEVCARGFRGGSRIFERGGPSQARTQDFLKGGLRHSQAPPPLDIVRVTSSALQKIEKHPHSWTFTSPPPLGHCPCDVIHIPRGGGGPTLGPMLKSLHCGPKGGGGSGPPGPPPPRIRHWGWYLFVMRHLPGFFQPFGGKNKK